MVAERHGVQGGWGYAVGVVGFLFLLASFGMLIYKTVTP
jgi:hypothetical protein